MLGHIQGASGCRFELAPLEISAAHRQGGQSLDRALHGRTDGARVQHIGAEVGAVVDARQHQIGPLIQQAEQGELDAVAGGAAAGPGGDPLGEEFIGPFRPDGGLKGEAMAGGGALLVRAHHRDLVPPLRRCRGQGTDAAGEDPVVVADQDPERCHGCALAAVAAGNLTGRLLTVGHPHHPCRDCRERPRQPAGARRPARSARGGGGRRHCGRRIRALEELRVGLLGKKGRLSGVLGAMGKLPAQEPPLVGQRANGLKEQVQGLMAERLQAVKAAAMAERIAQETLDVTAPCSFIPPAIAIP